MDELINKSAHEVKSINQDLFAPLSITNDSLSVVSPLESLRSSETYNDQVLEENPLLVEFTVEDINELFKEQVIPEGPILEIGCGTGVLVEALRKGNHPSYGIEILGTFGEIWRERKINQFCYVGNAENMSGVREGFMLVITRAFWDSVLGTHGQGAENNPSEIFKEIKRVLKTGGVLLPLAEKGHEANLGFYAKKFGFKEVIKDNKVVGYTKAGD